MAAAADNAIGPQQRGHGVSTPDQKMAQRQWTEVQEQLARQVQRRPRIERGTGRRHFKRHGCPIFLRESEQGVRHLVQRCGRAANQRLMTQNVPIAQRHDRLEYRLQRRQAHSLSGRGQRGGDGQHDMRIRVEWQVIGREA
jgi:hypothetical protein